MKEKNNSEQARRNRSNRKRGGNWEKKGADFLDMDVVPYSGSNARYGYGDVRDSVWLGEFKNITPDGDKITIDMGWLDKNLKRANDIGHKSFLAWMQAGTVIKCIILEVETFSEFKIPVDKTTDISSKIHNAKNIIIHTGDNYIKDICKGMIYAIHVNNNKVYIMMSIEKFKELLYKTGLKGERSGVQGM